MTLRDVANRLQQFMPVSERLRAIHVARIEEAVQYFFPLVEKRIERKLPALPVVSFPRGFRFMDEVIRNVDMRCTYDTLTGVSELQVHAGTSSRGFIRFPPHKYAWDYKVMHEIGHHVWFTTPCEIFEPRYAAKLWCEGFAEFFARDFCMDLLRNVTHPKNPAHEITYGYGLVRRALAEFDLHPLDIPVIWPQLYD
jgi:hypothetical protein